MTGARPRTDSKPKEKWELKLIGGYKFDEVTSAMQKMIRRGNEYEACFFGYILHQSGFGAYVWRRLSIIACEDIGLGEPMTPVIIDSLASSWEKLHKHNKLPSQDKFLLVVEALLYMCRAKKSRENDSLSNLIEENWKLGNRLEIPELAKDPHTDVGKEIYGKFGSSDGNEKQRLNLWFSKWSKVKNKAYTDKWEGKLKKIWYGRKGV